MNGRLTRIVLGLWQLPQIVLGLVVVGIFSTRRRITRREVSCVAPGTSIYRVTARRWLWGVSLGTIVLLCDHPSCDDTMVRHEYGHCIQSRMLGPLYLLVVGLPSITRLMWWRLLRLPPSDYYRGYPEAWADRLGGVKRTPA